MVHYDFKAPRLFVEADLATGRSIEPDGAQLNYLLNVLRLKNGARVVIFNGQEGEWAAELELTGRRTARLHVAEQLRRQTAAGDLWYCFAPLKTGRLDYMTQKAVEMGASRLVPVRTAHGQISRVNPRRMEANAIEAAEQCGILNLPEIGAMLSLSSLLDNWDAERTLIVCDESDEEGDPLGHLRRAPAGPLAVLVGPEGGFSAAERGNLQARSFVHRIGLGPRILRADTAAVAALALVQATLGDWR